MCGRSVCGLGRGPFQQTLDGFTDSDGFARPPALQVRSVVVSSPLSAVLWLSVNYFEEVCGGRAQKSKYSYVIERFASSRAPS